MFHHLGLTDVDAPLFSHVRHLCVSRSASRMKFFAQELVAALLNAKWQAVWDTKRSSLFLVGNHTMGGLSTRTLQRHIPGPTTGHLQTTSTARRRGDHLQHQLLLRGTGTLRRRHMNPCRGSQASLARQVRRASGLRDFAPASRHPKNC